MKDSSTDLPSSLSRFVTWLDRYGETSYDHQSFFAGPVGRAAKRLYYRRPAMGTAAVAPMIVCEAFFPSARRLFWKAQRFPIADAHYASGFAFLAEAQGSETHYHRAAHFLDVLCQTRSAGFTRHGWGYPFDWATRGGILREGTPMITSLPYMYEAFDQVYRLDKNPKWREIMRSIADHALLDYHDLTTGPNASSCSYTPNPEDPCGVVNASAYRAFLLLRAACEFQEPTFRDAGTRNLNFVLDCQNADGSWYYSMDGVRDFVDHFHTCFVLKALAKIEKLSGDDRLTASIERGIAYYVHSLFDDQRLPKPFSRAPRMTVYRRELYDYAEFINLATLLAGRFTELDALLPIVLQDVMNRWWKRDGSFRARELLVGWDNVPMHRWAQAQMFRSLAQLVAKRANGRSADKTFASREH